MNKKYLLGIILLAIVIIISIVVWKGSKNNVSRRPARSSASHRAALPKEVTIALSKNGFSPKQITVTRGGAVRWKNESGSQETVNSDNYPTNQLHRELNFGVFNNGSTVVYTFTKPGTYGYHNQFHPEQKGKIIVIQ